MENFYMKELGEIEVLGRDEEVALGMRVMRGDVAARNELVKANLRFVAKVALQYKNHGLALEDLISEGNIGLIAAAEKFDPTKGYRFITYAVWWIRQSIQKAIMECGKSVRIPQNNYQEFLKPDYNFASLEKELEGRNGEKFGDTLVDSRVMSPEQEYIEKETKEIVRETIQKLPSREREVLNLRFGLDGGEMESLDAVGKRLGLCKERVRQIEKKALVELRAKCVA